MIWAFDLATNTGWAVGRQEGGSSSPCHIGSGTWDLRPRRGDGPGMRSVLLRQRLNELLGAWGKPRLVTYEDALMRGQAPREILYGLRTALQGWCEENGISGYRSVNTTALKGFAQRTTGRKGKLKDLDCEAATLLVGFPITDTDRADAILLMFVPL